MIPPDPGMVLTHDVLDVRALIAFLFLYGITVRLAISVLMSRIRRLAGRYYQPTRTDRGSRARRTG